jgi:hypothetical protein
VILIGTSLCGCLKSLAKGEVKIADVLVVISETECKTCDELLSVIEYYATSKFTLRYDMACIDVDTLLNLGRELWLCGKIHQPRLCNGLVRLPEEFETDNIWHSLVPNYNSDSPAVIDAYEKYLLLRSLTE